MAFCRNYSVVCIDFLFAFGIREKLRASGACPVFDIAVCLASSCNSARLCERMYMCDNRSIPDFICTAYRTCARFNALGCLSCRSNFGPIAPCMSCRSDFCLLCKDSAAYGALTAFRKPSRCTGRCYCRNSLSSMACCRNCLLSNKDFATY